MNMLLLLSLDRSSIEPV